MNNQTTQGLVFKQLDLITESIHKTAKEWEITNIPTNTIEMTVTKGYIDVKKLPRKDRRNENIMKFFTEYNTLIDSIIAQSKKDASEMGTNSIPLELFDSYIDIVKGAFVLEAKKE
jgi:hypothetical protein